MALAKEGNCHMSLKASKLSEWASKIACLVYTWSLGALANKIEDTIDPNSAVIWKTCNLITYLVIIGYQFDTESYQHKIKFKLGKF